jgi:hypothetical protein
MLDEKGYKVTIKEMLMGRVAWEDVDADVQANLLDLRERINKVREKCKADTGKGFKVNDGLRRRGKDKPKNGAEKSNHYLGNAVDIDDDDTLWLWKWCEQNLKFIWECGLWMEDPRWTHGKGGTWMHFQRVAPGSGKFIFRPSMAEAPAPDIWDGKYDAKYDEAYGS